MSYVVVMEFITDAAAKKTVLGLVEINFDLP